MTEVYRCDTCGTTSTNPADALLKYFCRECARRGRSK